MVDTIQVENNDMLDYLERYMEHIDELENKEEEYSEETTNDKDFYSDHLFHEK